MVAVTVEPTVPPVTRWVRDHTPVSAYPQLEAPLSLHLSSKPHIGEVHRETMGDQSARQS